MLSRAREAAMMRTQAAEQGLTEEILADEQ
jgi:hypothetical protein